MDNQPKDSRRRPHADSLSLEVIFDFRLFRLLLIYILMGSIWSRCLALVDLFARIRSSTCTASFIAMPDQLYNGHIWQNWVPAEVSCPLPLSEILGPFAMFFVVFRNQQIHSLFNWLKFWFPRETIDYPIKLDTPAAVFKGCAVHDSSQDGNGNVSLGIWTFLPWGLAKAALHQQVFSWNSL